ncbi:MAG TPA: metalloregulator ArsR/SmtB family transcription factor [Xanthobacteraceae bacterium]|nr:metalloregulator ArsR/SmtB family transcription factor [Xanthobacteraceae bacterium]
MVNHRPDRLDGIFAALSDPTRRALLTRLSEAPEFSVTTLARPLAMSLPAVLKHLAVLEVAGLIQRRKTGRTVSCWLNAAPLREAQRWLSYYERFWSDRLDAFARYLTEEAADGLPLPTLPRKRGRVGSGDATASPTPNMEPRPCPRTLKPPPRTRNRASSSSAGSRRRRSAASAPGPSRKR